MQGRKKLKLNKGSEKRRQERDEIKGKQTEERKGKHRKSAEGKNEIN